MATVAFSGFMLVFELVFGVSIMVKSGFFPIFGIMAILAFNAIATFMHVILGVA